MAFNSCKNKENCAFRGVCSDLIRQSLNYEKHNNINVCTLYFRQKYRERKENTLTFTDKEMFENGELPNTLRFDSTGQYSLDFGTD